MSKKPVPSKKQASSSTGSRWGSYVRKQRVKLKNKITLGSCGNCGAKKMAHFVCPDCGWYGERKIIETKSTTKPVQEIEA